MNSEIEASTKTCTSCAAEKSLNEFYAAKGGKFGRHARCKECTREYSKNRYRENEEYREGQLAMRRERRIIDPDYREKCIASTRAYMKTYTKSDAYRESQRVYNVKYCAENPHIKWRLDAIRRMAKYGYDPVVEHFTREDVVQEYGDGCFYCQDGPFAQIDHYKSIFSGGPHTLANVRPCCAGCNSRKRAKDGDTFIASMLD